MSMKNDIIEAEFRTKGASIVQRNMSKISKEIAILTENNKDLKLAKAKLEAADKKYIAGTKKLTKEYQSVNDQVKKNNELLTIQKGKLQVQASKLKVSEMSAGQLRKKMNALNKELNDPITKVLPDRHARLSKELAEVERHMGKVKTGTKQTNSVMVSMRQALPTLGLAAFLGGLVKVGTELFELSKQMQGDSVRSSVVLGDSYDMVAKKAEKMAAKMGLTNREFIANTAAAADLLVPLGFERDIAADMAVKLQALVGPLDEWTGGKHGAAEVSSILTKALLGENEQLKLLGVAVKMDSKEFTDLVKQYQLRQGVTRGQAQAMAELELITRKSADAQTAYLGNGNKLLRFQKKITAWWQKKKEAVVAYFDVDLETKTRDEIKQTNLLTIELTNANTTAERRNEIYAELKNIAPDVVKGIDAENLSMSTLRKNLEKYNDAMIKKLAMQDSEVALQDKRDYAGKMANDRAEAELALQMELLSVKQQVAKFNPNLAKSIDEIIISDQELLKKKELVADLVNPKVSGPEKVLTDIKASYYIDDIVESRIAEEAAMKQVNKALTEYQERYQLVFGNKKEDGGQTTKVGNLIKEQQILLEDAKKMPQATEEEIAARNRKLEVINTEIKRLNELGTSQLNLGKFIKQSNEDQVEQIKEYFKGVGADAYEGFKQAYEDTATQDPLNLNPVTEEEEVDFDPESNYEIQQFMQTSEFKEELLRIQRENGVIGEQEYQDRLTEINKKSENERYKQKVAYSQKAQQMAQLGANFVDALMQLELAAAGDNEEKKKQIRKKYAVMQFMASASGIVVDTASAVMKALAQLGPIAGPIAAGIVGATGAVQLGVAYKEMETVKGLEDGGYTNVRRAQDGKEFRAKYSPNRRGFIDKPSLLVGENGNEFVANAETTSKFRPFFDVIDAAQRGGTIETLSMPAVTQALAVEGRESGGYTNNQSTNDSETTSTNNELKNLISGTAQLLADLKQNGIKSKAIIKPYGKDSLDEGLKNRDKFYKSINN